MEEQAEAVKQYAEAVKYCEMYQAEKALADRLWLALTIYRDYIMHQKQGTPEQWDESEKSFEDWKERRGKE
jgi:uncharacterized short protein YbdD (DUF466 family)